jgi:carbamoyltransferase
MKTAILGINAYHGDASAAIVIDGRLIAAVEEERFNRIKHWAGFPAESIRYCLEAGSVRAQDVEHVAISFNPRSNLLQRLSFVAKHRPAAPAIWDRIKRQGKTLGLRKQFAAAVGCPAGEIKARFHRIDHHASHAAAGFFASPFHEAAILSIDGMGDFASTLLAHGHGLTRNELRRVYFPHSLGFLYSAVTMFLGFPHYGDEYKVMGLAPYGEPEFLDVFREFIRPTAEAFELNLEYFTHHTNGIRMAWNDGAPVVGTFHSRKMEEELGPLRKPDEEVTSQHENIARSLQAVTEEIIIHLLRRLHRCTNCPNVCLVGGVAMNSVANGKVTRETPFERVYVPAGAADNGTSFGAALEVWCRILGQPRKFVQEHALWGCEFSDEECEVAIRQASLPFETFEQNTLIERTTDLLRQGKVVGWFQGRMEFGARALGNRSLLADPSRTDMREIINLRIKFREKFRPFAPSILEEYIGEWFEVNEPAPYMEKVFPIRTDKRARIPAVTHIDGTGRLQSVSKNTNPLYHALISRFHDETGIPILLNTSLNENEPIVRTPEQAISCFLRTDMDAIALGSHLVNRGCPGFPFPKRVER